MKINFFLALLGVVANCFAVPADITIIGRVIKVSEGDTLTVLRSNNRTRTRVRLAEIDAPGRRQAFGRESRESLSSMCSGETAAVYGGKSDRYGMIVGRVYCAGTDTTAEQIRRGMAWVRRQVSHDDGLLEQERVARYHRIGLWSAPDPVPPWEFGKRQKK